MAAGTATLVKQITVVHGFPTVVSKILPRKEVHDTVIVVVPGNPGIIDFYDVYLESLFRASGCKVPVYGVEHAGIFVVLIKICISSLFNQLMVLLSLIVRLVILSSIPSSQVSRECKKKGSFRIVNDLLRLNFGVSIVKSKFN